mgnify:FL=1
MARNIWFYSGDITNSGGTERVATIIANELNKLDDIEVSIVSLVEKRSAPFFDLDETIKRYTIYDTPVRGITHIGGIIKRTRALIKDKKVDILIDIDGILEMYTIPAAVFTKTKIVSWEHYNFYQNPVVKYRKYTRRMAARWADAIITLTEEDKQYYNENLNVKCPIQCIYNPVIWEKEVVQYDLDSKTILSVGRLTYQKGFDMLVEVADLFLKKYPDWNWIILGEGEDRESLERQIKEKGLEKQLILKGNVENVSEYYAKASMFVMTSRFEGLPMTLLETKPHKLPIVSFNCKTGPSELIEDGVNGYLVQEENLDEMAEKIQQLMNNSSLRKNFSENALMNMDKFELEAIVNKWIKMLNNI